MCLLADHVGQVEDGGGDVGSEGVGDVGQQALDRALAGDESLHAEADKGDHREAAVLDLLHFHLWGVHAHGVEGELVDEARLQRELFRSQRTHDGFAESAQCTKKHANVDEGDVQSCWTLKANLIQPSCFVLFARVIYHCEQHKQEEGSTTSLKQ